MRKQTRKPIGTFNASWIGQFTEPVSRTVSLQSVDGGDHRNRDLPASSTSRPSLRGVVNNVIGNVPDSAGDGAANYDTLELAFNKRFASGLFVDASVDVTRADDLRNANGVSNSPLTQADPIPSTYFENIYPVVEQPAGHVGVERPLVGPL